MNWSFDFALAPEQVRNLGAHMMLAATHMLYRAHQQHEAAMGYPNRVPVEERLRMVRLSFESLFGRSLHLDRAVLDELLRFYDEVGVPYIVRCETSPAPRLKSVP
jgi:hypothetical protein